MKYPYALVFHPDFSLHLTGRGHPESPDRYKAIVKALQAQNLWHNALQLQAKQAPFLTTLACHDAQYIEKVQIECAQSTLNQLSTGDVQICSQSYEVALLAAGAGIKALYAIFEGKTNQAFCIVRPPGHHATISQGMGFCLFNNVAIAARYAQKTFGIKKVLIADWDVHHGNGTQDIFYRDPSVFYFSTHQEGIYPGTGTCDEKGVGNIYNYPIQSTPNARIELLRAYEETLPYLMEEFKPDLILVSAGFDAHEADPLGGLNLKTEDFGKLTKAIQKLAEKHCEGKWISFLEGGYNLEALTASVCAHVAALKM
ncbi:MAG: histone deacetylase family protein [Parachlamydiaceae bacterium]